MCAGEFCCVCLILLLSGESALWSSSLDKFLHVEIARGWTDFKVGAMAAFCQNEGEASGPAYQAWEVFFPWDSQHARAVCCNMKGWEKADDDSTNKLTQAPTPSQSTVAFSLMPNPGFLSAQTSKILQKESFELLIIFFWVVYRILQACWAILRAECGHGITNVTLITTEFHQRV